jgi:predicted nucleic acid-binding protein
VIVVDTNVIAALVYRVETSSTVDRLFEKEAEWAAPVLWRSELRNILATQIRVGTVDLVDALGMAETAEGVLAGREFSVDSASILRLAAESRCTAYDCEFVVLARHLGARLVTFDRQVLAAFPELAIHPKAFVAKDT